jgi:hypothetical protein
MANRIMLLLFILYVLDYRLCKIQIIIQILLSLTKCTKFIDKGYYFVGELPFNALKHRFAKEVKTKIDKCILR